MIARSTAIRRARAAVATAALAVIALVAAAPTASADGPCGAAYTYRAYWPMYHGSTMVGHVSVYYSASLGRLCSIAWTYGPERGVDRFRYIKIQNSARADVDYGYFDTYVGPVSIPLNGSCVDIFARFGPSERPYSVRSIQDIFCGVKG